VRVFSGIVVHMSNLASRSPRTGALTSVVAVYSRRKAKQKGNAKISRKNGHVGNLLRLIMPTVVAVSCLIYPLNPAHSAESVVGWIKSNAVRLNSTDPAAPPDDLAPVRAMVGNARVVALGESTHGAHEEATLKHRVLRFLVEQMGFRSIAWEEDWTMGLLLDDYIRTGRGDLNALLSETDWNTREVAGVLRWLRGYNARHADKVRFVGVEFYATRPLAYDAVTTYVAEYAPALLPELERHLRVVRPNTSNMADYVGWYFGVTDKSPYIRHARQVYDLVEQLPHSPGGRAYDLALQHARQIRSFYEFFDLGSDQAAAYRDSRAADNLRWWHRRTGHKIAYWAATPHTANAPGLQVSQPPTPTVRYDSAGSYLRRWYGNRYRSIGFTFDNGAVNAGTGMPPWTPRPVQVPRPALDFAERPLGDAGLDQYALNLHADAPPAVRSWRQSSAKTRVIGTYDPAKPGDYYMTGGSLSQWFDVIIHRQKVTPTQPQSIADRPGGASQAFRPSV
jgi:erythromycin esterase-like protein